MSRNILNLTETTTINRHIGVVKENVGVCGIGVWHALPFLAQNVPFNDIFSVQCSNCSKHHSILREKISRKHFKFIKKSYACKKNERNKLQLSYRSKNVWESVDDETPKSMNDIFECDTSGTYSTWIFVYIYQRVNESMLKQILCSVIQKQVFAWPCEYTMLAKSYEWKRH